MSSIIIDENLNKLSNAFMKRIDFKSGLVLTDYPRLCHEVNIDLEGLKIKGFRFKKDIVDKMKEISSQFQNNLHTLIDSIVSNQNILATEPYIGYAFLENFCSLVNFQLGIKAYTDGSVVYFIIAS